MDSLPKKAVVVVGFQADREDVIFTDTEVHVVFYTTCSCRILFLAERTMTTIQPCVVIFCRLRLRYITSYDFHLCFVLQCNVK